MSNQAIMFKAATPYAEALLDVAQENNYLDKINEDLSLISNLLAESVELQLFLDNPLITSIAKKNVLNNLLANQVNHVVLKFVLVLVDRRRITLLSSIIQKYFELAYRLDSIIIAQISTSIALTEQQQLNLIQKIKDMTKSKKVKLVITIDSNLIGGLIIKIGSRVIDTSLIGKLRSMSFYLQQDTSSNL